MDPKRGDLFLLKLGDGEAVETFTTIAGLRPTEMTVNGETVDTTHKGSGGWRALLPGGGIKSIDITAGGVFLEGANSKELRALSISGEIRNMQIDDGEDIVECGFQVGSFSQSGEHNNEQSFNTSLNSSGVPTVTPVS